MPTFVYSLQASYIHASVADIMFVICVYVKLLKIQLIKYIVRLEHPTLGSQTVKQLQS